MVAAPGATAISCTNDLMKARDSARSLACRNIRRSQAKAVMLSMSSSTVSVTTVANRMFASCWSSQARISGCGWSRMNSETTLVSRTIITVGSVKSGRLTYRFPRGKFQLYAAERLEQLAEGRAEVFCGDFLLLPEHCSQDDVGLITLSSGHAGPPGSGRGLLRAHKAGTALSGEHLAGPG